jgi:hypothetical protein
LGRPKMGLQWNKCIAVVDHAFKDVIYKTSKNYSNNIRIIHKVS